MASPHVLLADEVVDLLNDGEAPTGLDAERRVLPAEKPAGRSVYVFVGPAKRERYTRDEWTKQAVVYVAFMEPTATGVEVTTAADAAIELCEAIADKIAAAEFTNGSLASIDDEADAETYLAGSLKERGLFVRVMSLRFDL